MSGIYSTVTFGPHGEVFVWHQVMPLTDLQSEPQGQQSETIGGPSGAERMPTPGAEKSAASPLPKGAKAKSDISSQDANGRIADTHSPATRLEPRGLTQK